MPAGDFQEQLMVDKKSNTLYTTQQVDEIARQAAQYAVQQTLQTMNLGNCIQDRTTPTMEGDENMGRQKVHVILPNGEPVWITGATNSEIVRIALEKYGNMGSVHPPASGELFKDYTEKIFDIFLRPRWKPSTAETNRFLLDKHIMPYFHDMPLSAIDTMAVQQFFQTKQHLSKSYTKQMLIMLHEIFENAVEDGKIPDDPTKSKRITLPQKATKRGSLEDDQFYDIISHIDELDPENALLLALLCFTGMRRGEILGLKWDCVLEDRIVVRSEVTFKGNSPTYNEYTKSASGIREIPIPKELKPYLANRGEGFVLGGDKPYTQSKFDRAWQRIGKTINLYGATPHVFRHTYLTMLAASGVDPKTIQSLAGHADFSFTFNKYIDRNRRNVQSASDQLSDRIQKLTQKLTSPETLQPSKINGLKGVNSPEN